MSTAEDTFYEPNLNVIQVIAFDIAVSAALIVTLKSMGLSWGVAALGGLFLGAFATVSAAFVLIGILSRFGPRVTGDHTTPNPHTRPELPPLVHPSITDTEAVWNADLLLEKVHARSDVSSSVHQIRTWMEDAKAEKSASDGHQGFRKSGEELTKKRAQR